MLELLRWERFRPRQVYRTEIHTVNLPKQLSLSWFLKVLPRYFVCTCHMTHIRHHILIKTDTSVFPGKAPILRLQEKLNCSVHVTAAWASSLLKGRGGERLPGSRCTCGQSSLVILLFAGEQATERHKLTQGVLYSQLVFYSNAPNTDALEQEWYPPEREGFPHPRAHLHSGLQARNPSRIGNVKWNGCY